MAMMQLMLLRAGFVVFCAFVGIVAWWINGLIFDRFEVTEGVNLVYWPHGLRVVLTLMFERYAAIGLTLGAYAISWRIWPEDDLIRWLLRLLAVAQPFWPCACYCRNQEISRVA